ncbi:HNH endonuclease [Chloroflexota bacterium]
MARRSGTDPFAKIWAGVLIAVAAAAIIWDTVPHWILYVIGGLVVAVIVDWLITRLRHSGLLHLIGLARLGSRSSDERGNVGTSSQLTALPRLSSADQARLRRVVGDRCENPFCKQPDHRGLQVHHIIPRRNPRSTNKLDNLSVLCPNCHDDANHGRPGTAVQQGWARDRKWFVEFERVRDRDSMH